MKIKLTEDDALLIPIMNWHWDGSESNHCLPKEITDVRTRRKL